MAHLAGQQTGHIYPISEPIWRGSNGELLDIEFEATFPIDDIAKRPTTLWRYREAIPIENDESIVSFGEGFTAMIPLNIGGKEILVKQDHLFPTGSYKDRGATVMISKTKELGINYVVEDSSGNAGSAIAAYSAQANISCEIYVPAYTSKGKLVQMAMYGADLKLVEGNRDATSQAVMSAAESAYYVSHGWNPFFFHGTKTFAFEICEQLGWEAPDSVVLPAGNGTLLIGAYIGFRELQKAGIIEHIPKIIGIQPEHCSALVKAYQTGLTTAAEIDASPTIAEGIAISKPVRGHEILDYVRTSGGMLLSVSEEEIKKALLDMTSAGHFIEPTSAATIAGISKYLPHSTPGEKIVSVFTGHGLKATGKLETMFN